MRAKEREALQKEVNRMTEYRKEAERVFKKLQDLNHTEGTGNRWCSAAQNYRDLAKCGKDYLWLYEKYVEARAKEDAVITFGAALAGVGFWK